MLSLVNALVWLFFFFQAEDGIRDADVTGVQTCALPIFREHVTDRRLLHVEDLAADGEQRLELAVARMPGRAEGRVSLDDEEFGLGDVAGSAESEERRVGKECRSRRARQQ